MVRGIKAILFDMDGVIVDSEPLHLLAYQKFFSSYDIGYTANDNAEFLGTKDTWMANVLIDRYGLKETAAELVKIKEDNLLHLIKESAEARPGLYDILDRAAAKKIPMAVASSATIPTINLVIDTLKIRHYFQALASGDEVQHGKPAPDVFLLAAKRLDAAPENCLVIEDTLNGIRAAKAAGMHCVAIPCEETKHQDHSEADIRLCSLEEVDLECYCA